MAFTFATLTHQFPTINGANAIGEVTFTLVEEMSNGADTYAEGSVIEETLSAGALSATVPSNVDTGTVPTIPQPQWRVDIRIVGSPVQTFFITVPASAGTIDLFTLIPSEEQVS